MKLWWRSRYVWLVILLVAINALVFGMNYVNATWWWPKKVALTPGLRADLVKVEKPWKKSLDMAQKQAKTEQAPEPPEKIDLKLGQANLEKAISNGAGKVERDVAPVLSCKLWGPLLPGEDTRVSDALKGWTGQEKILQKRVPIAYVVYLPKAIVDQGLGIAQLQDKGVSEVFFMASPGPLQGAISLGLFRDEERAQLQQQNLLSKGIPGVQIHTRLGPVRTYYQLTGTDKQIAEINNLYQLNRRGDLSDCPEKINEGATP